MLGRVIGLATVAATLAAFPTLARDPAQRAAFVHTHPCPATGKTHGACPGWVVDHIVPLCKGGADAPWNMQWQTYPDSKLKDAWECRK